MRSAYWAFLLARNREFDAAPLGGEEGEDGQVAGCGQGEARQGQRPGQGEGHCVGVCHICDCLEV